MWYATGLWPLACLLIASPPVVAQTIFHNDGNVVTVTPGATVFVQGGVNNHNDGALANGGTFYLSGDWSSNTPLADEVASLPGTFVFNGGRQTVFGASRVAFPTVVAAGTDRKVQVGTDVSIAGELRLNDLEWATNVNRVHVLNTDPFAITRTSGFVSSDTIGGYLVRNMDRDADYLYPVGSTGDELRNPVPRYRPVYIRPSGASVADAYAVRFGNIDPSLDDTDGGPGFDRGNSVASLNQINDEFYHMVDHPAGSSPADLRFYYFLSDGRYSTVAQVQDDGRWTDMFGEVNIPAVPSVPNIDGADRVAVLRDHSDFTQPVFAEAGADNDNDGIANLLDLDADNDGIANLDESPSDPYGDHDNDGFFDYIDPDFPGCGSLVNGICGNFDFDGDGLANHLDLDSDADGIADIIEAGGVDADRDAYVDFPVPGDPYSMIDVDRDGFADERDYLDSGKPGPEVTSGARWPSEDRDNDGAFAFFDIDADADGIVDIIEAQPTVGYLFPNNFDGNGNGLDQAFDPLEGGLALVPTNTDGADQPDYLDLNSDNSRTSDLAEGHDLTGDGLAEPTLLPTGGDLDGDGLDDRYDLSDRVTDAPNNATNFGQSPYDFPAFEAPGLEMDWRVDGCPLQNCTPLNTARNRP